MEIAFVRLAALLTLLVAGFAIPRPGEAASPEESRKEGVYQHKRMFGLARQHLVGEAGECAKCHSIHSSGIGSLLKTSERGICLPCHKPSPARLAHKPAAEGKCSACHLPHSSEVKGLLRVQGEELCLPCHKGKAGGLHRRGNIPGLCLDCHPPHGSNARRLTRGKMSKAQCLICHAIMLRGKVIHSGVMQKDCRDCHDPHSDPPVTLKGCAACHPKIGTGKVVHKPLEKGCMECHGSHTAPEARILFTPVPGQCTDSCHPEKAGGRHGKRVLLQPCTRCHDPHASDLKKLIKPGFGGLACLDCHGGIIEDAFVHATAGAGRCPDCHDPHNPKPKPPIQCVDCHDEVAKGRSIHPPVQKGCHLCHDPHASPRRYQLKGDFPAFCLSCHKENAEGRHGPIKLEGSCLTCHRPHASGRPGLLTAKGTAAPCASCHPGRKEGASVHRPAAEDRCPACHDPHADPPIPVSPCGSCHPQTLAGAVRHRPAASGERGCLACHLSHASGKPRLLKESVPALCLACHPERKEGAHGRTALGNDCLTCHRPHAAPFAGLRERAGFADCEGCHREKRSGRFLHPALRERACPACHDPHASPPAPAVACQECHQELVRDNPMHGSLTQEQCLACHDPHSSAVRIKPTRGSSAKDCLPCHDDVSRAIKAAESLHAPLSTRGCAPCHSAHSGEKPYLTLAYSLEFRRAWSAPAFALCLSCHPAALVTGGDNPAVTRFRDGPRNLHAVHSIGASDNGYACWACHDAHAGFQKHLLNDAPTYNPNHRLGLRFVGDKGGGNCESACHPLRGYER